MYKVQVKYCKVHEDQSTKLSLRSCMSNKTFLYEKRYSKSEVDVFAAYVPSKDLCLCIKSDILDRVNTTFTIRLSELSKSGQVKGINFYTDYLDFPFS